MWRCQKYKLITDNKRRLPGTPRRAQFSIGTHKHTAVIMFCWHTMPGHHTALSRADPHTSYPLSWETDAVLCSSYQLSLVHPFQHISEFKFVFINAPFAFNKCFWELFWPPVHMFWIHHQKQWSQRCASGDQATALQLRSINWQWSLHIIGAVMQW